MNFQECDALFFHGLFIIYLLDPIKAIKPIFPNEKWSTSVEDIKLFSQYPKKCVFQSLSFDQSVDCQLCLSLCFESAFCEQKRILKAKLSWKVFA